MAKKANHPKATNWEKLSGRSDDQTLKNRDVFEGQQLDRSSIDGLQTKTSRRTVAIIVGAVVTLVAWVVVSVVLMVFGMLGIGGSAAGTSSSSNGYYSIEQINGSTVFHCYQINDSTGQALAGTPCYDTEAEAIANPPAWWTDKTAAAQTDAPAADGGGTASVAPAGGFVGELLTFGWWKLLISLLAGLGTFSLLYSVLMRNLDAQNLMNDTSDINQYTGDQHIALPDEVMRKFDWFPDVGAHSDVQFSSMISHVMLTNKGLKKIQTAVRADKDVLDEDGDVDYLKGEILRDENEDAIMQPMPMIDEAFGSALFDASGIPASKTLRKTYDTTLIPYNGDGSDRDKLGKHKTVADLINSDWTLPEYEVQRPGGAYLVDTAPVNTMVLAITRGGKGQTYIEPVIDMWLREKRPSNMVINDPKGELLVKNYVRATMRGFQVVQFNLINSMKTDIYNPLGMAADAAREGDATKCALYVENIADVFFPTDGGEDPVWPNAANNAFKRAAYGLIDFYLEEERELRAYAARTDMDPKILDKRLDEMWGKVTLYNCYQLFVQLTAKKKKNPVKDLESRAKRGEFGDPQGDDFRADEYEEEREVALRKAVLWEDKDEVDLLTLFFNATQNLPQNAMRTLVGNADNALRAMGAAEKMLASVYGIALTAMSFFTDPTISTLTSGAPSQNTDLGGLSFPRRMGVRFGMNYLKRDHLIGSQAKWDAFGDPMFENSLGKDFEHEDIVSREGWARYYFQGKFDGDVAYIRLRLVNAQTGTLIRTFYFRFTKDYQTSLNGRQYISDPITKTKIVKNGILVELKPVTDEKATSAQQWDADFEAAGAGNAGAETVGSDAGEGLFRSFRPSTASDERSNLRAIGRQTGRQRNPVEPVVKAYEPGHTTYPQMRLTNIANGLPDKEMGQAHAIISNMVRYSENPKVVFLVTPPHLMKYAKLILILVKQLVDLNFDKSYMTKSNQKPLYKTRFMLDELGNLQSEGHGISGFETMLSIGLGQEQQFTIILQTLQQLRDVYGESVDKIVQGNTSNIVFLKSTDDSMLDTLQKMSGTRHVTYRDSKTVTKDTERMIKGLNVEGKVSYTMNTKEEPVITYNDMAFISERNSIVFRAGDAPVWNRNETILPMSYRLFQDTIVHPGHEYSLQTIPTLGSALEFDVRLNQPDFEKMLAKRVLQAENAADCKKVYRVAYDYKDVDIARLDPDVYSDEVMELIDASLRESVAEETGGEADDVDLDDAPEGFYDNGDWEADIEMQQAAAAAQANAAVRQEPIYAGKQISRDMLVRADGRALQNTLDREIVEAYKAARAYMERDSRHFSVGAGGSLRSADGQTLYIDKLDESAAMQALNNAAQSETSGVYAEEDISGLIGYDVTSEFYEFLASLETWRDLAGGEFDRAMMLAMRDREDA
ncbi:type IV secretory system conjugative DNA transfer family protein [Cryobacterium zhongshanensis]|uniref:Type IV secretory system conjugative DNA transfer family protein n=1 Tax=Cryobacterium zhongshanensis TaxID=2928153 RepID=A0AA41QY24_9MICO|nr:type IV secretory system conjugative DNA transfer family protein [Cryobacterium zhongshanensis]MCI4659595.1 type IV secretory system conjugative DNA transfer family protein [Cryobacterium zhongshanensis]